MTGAHRLIRTLLALAILGMGVPAWRHSHPDGDVHHRHERGHAHQHGHHVAGMGASHAHLHVSLFGVEFTLPVENDDDDSEQGETSFLASCPTVVVPAPSAADFAVVTRPCFGVGERSPDAATFRLIAASVAPLSDNARHERSGVQLI